MATKMSRAFPASVRAFIVTGAPKTAGAVFGDCGMVLLTVVGVALCTLRLFERATGFSVGVFAGIAVALPLIIFADLPLAQKGDRRRTLLRLLAIAVSAIIVLLFLRKQIGITTSFIYFDLTDGESGWREHLIEIGEYSAATLRSFAFITGVVLSVLFTLIIFYLEVAARTASIAIIITLIPVIAAAVMESYTDSIPNIFGIFILIASWVTLIASQLSQDSSAFMAVIIGCLLCAGLGIAIVYGFGLERPYFIDNGIKIISEGQEMPDRFKDVNLPPFLNTEGVKPRPETEAMKMYDSLERSELAFDGRFTFDGKPVLNVRMDFSPYDNTSVYLRHFFGANYTVSAWEALSDTQKSAEENVVSSFLTGGLTPYNFDSYSYSNMIMNDTSSVRRGDFQITNTGVGTNRAFLPYFLELNSDFFDGDPFAEIADTTKSYGGSYEMPFGFLSNEKFLSDVFSNLKLDPDPVLMADELSYRDFVYNNYLDVPSTFIAENPVLDEQYMDFITAETQLIGKSTLTSREVFVRKLNYIQNWLRDNCEYQIAVDPLPAGEDFALYFLNVSRKGFCQHFATSAVLLCRAAGIPARYVTGFIIPATDYNTVTVNPGDLSTDSINYRSVDVDDSRAHAWIEVYVDGFGWLPMDFTSGYSNVRTSLSVSQRVERSDEDPTVNITENVEEPVPAPQNLPETTAKPNEPKPETPLPTELEQTFDTRTLFTVLIIVFVVFSVTGVVLYVIIQQRKSVKNPPATFRAIAKATLRILKMGGISTAHALEDTDAYLEKLAASDYAAAVPIIKDVINAEYGHIDPDEDTVSDYRIRRGDIALIYYRKQKFFKRLYLKYFLNIL